MSAKGRRMSADRVDNRCLKEKKEGGVVGGMSAGPTGGHRFRPFLFACWDVFSAVFVAPGFQVVLQTVLLAVNVCARLRRKRHSL